MLHILWNVPIFSWREGVQCKIKCPFFPCPYFLGREGVKGERDNVPLYELFFLEGIPNPHSWTIYSGGSGAPKFLIFRGYEAQSKCHIGISPSGPKKRLWDQSQCHVHAVIGIDPNVIKNMALGSVPKSCTCCSWDWSQYHEKQDIGIGLKVLYMQ